MDLVDMESLQSVSVVLAEVAEGVAQISNVQAPATVFTGAAFTVTCTVTNVGGDDTIFVKLIDYGGMQLSEFRQFMTAGQSMSISLPGVAPANAGTYVYTVRAGHTRPQLTVTAVTQQNNPLAGATVTILKAGTSTKVKEQTTGSNGSTSFSLQEGTYDITVWKLDYTDPISGASYGWYTAVNSYALTGDVSLTLVADYIKIV